MWLVSLAELQKNLRTIWDGIRAADAYRREADDGPSEDDFDDE